MQRAYTDLLQRILKGDLAQGTLLNRRGVAQELGMSPAPVLEAMVRLENEGFLEALPRQGTRVRSMGREDMRGHLVVREALESQAARMICGGAVNQQMERLLPLATFADSSDTADFEKRIAAEVDFHLALVELADCPALLREYRRIMQTSLFYHINILEPAQRPKSSKPHLELLEELSAATLESAAACVRKHLWSEKPDSLNYK